MNLEKAIKDGEFRLDLFYRLNVITLSLQPLRQRKDDIILLANHFLDEFCRDMGKPRIALLSEASKRLLNAPWPGNVRELRNLIERKDKRSAGGVQYRELAGGNRNHTKVGKIREIMRQVPAVRSHFLLNSRSLKKL